MEFFDYVLKNGNAFVGKTIEEDVDIGVKNKKISLIGKIDNNKAKKIYNMKNLTILPGCIDSQVHFREPGLTHKEDINSGTKGAILGGITSVFEMPNTNPSTSTVEALNEKLKIANTNSFCNYSFYIGAVRENIESLNILEKSSGCSGIKIFMGSSTGSLLIEDDKTLEKILANGSRRVAIHSEDEYRLRDRKKIINAKNVSVHVHPVWRDSISALKSTKRLIKIAKKVSRKIHILHISTTDEIELINKNKNFVTAEATPQHLFFSSPDCYNKIGTLSQMNPPIRSKKHQEGIWLGVKKKIIDVIGSDHAPHTLEEKNKEYPNSPSGMTGVQTLVPIMLNFVNQQRIGIHDFVRLTSANPSKIFRMIGKGKIEVGYDADLTIVDLKKKKKIENNWIASKSGWTPYDGEIVIGWPIHTVVNGEIVMSEDQVLGKPKGEKIKFNFE